LVVDERKALRLFCVIPIYPEEMDLKLERGGEGWVERLQEAGVTVLLDPGRRNVCV
jgi:hypothetical protein